MLFFVASHFNENQLIKVDFNLKNYYNCSSRFDLKSFKRKITSIYLNNFKQILEHIISVSIVFMLPVVFKFVLELIKSFNSLTLKGIISVSILFGSISTQQVFNNNRLGNTTSHCYILLSNSIFSLLLFFDYLLRLKIIFYIKNISEFYNLFDKNQLVFLSSDSIENNISLHSSVNSIQMYQFIQFIGYRFVLPNKLSLHMFYCFSNLFYYPIFKILFLISLLKKNVNFNASF